jgi:hypothetical protein
MTKQSDKAGISSFPAFFVFLAVSSGPSLACTLVVEQPDVIFPVEKMNVEAVCRLAEVVNDYTSHQVLPAVPVPIKKPLYDFLLNHPVLTSELITGLNVGGYRVDQLAAGVFHGEDNAGGEAVLTLLYQDPRQRVYHLKGSQSGYVVPITGSGVVMLNYQPKPGSDGREIVETKVTVYSKLDNFFLARLVKLLRPLLQRIVNKKLTRGVQTVHDFAEILANDPERVYRQLEKVTREQASEIQAFRALLLPSLKKN